MIGRGVLRECLRDESVDSVLAVGRSPLAVTHPELRELVRADPCGPGSRGRLRTTC